MILVITTVSDADAAEALATRLVEKKLAACVQIMPEMRSIYAWQGKIFNEFERLLLIKTVSEKYSELEEFIRANHAYETPEIVAFNAENVSKTYETWLVDYLTKDFV